MRPGKAKGPFVGTSSGGGGGGSLAAATWYAIGEFTYEDFETAGPEFSLTGLAIPANAVFYAIRVRPTTAFVLPGASFYNLRAGIVGVEDLYLPDYDLLGLAPGNAVFGFGSIANGHIESLAGWNMRLTAESDGDLDDATAGVFQVAVQYAVIP